MESKVSPITNIKQIQAYLQEESKSIKYQTITFKINISEDIKNVGPPPKSILLLHELIQWIPLFGIMKSVHACWKSRKNQIK